jgi:hypothetical protein
MKKTFLLMALIIAVSGIISAEPLTVGGSGKSSMMTEPSVVIYYFHLSRRCTTCRSVEENARKAVSELWPEKIKSGEYKFMAINIELDENEALAKKAGVSGQALVVISGENRSDITDKAFLLASNYEKIKELLKSTVEKVKK